MRETSKIVNESLLGKDKIEIVGHARRNMRLRNVREDEAIAAIRSPDERGLPTQRGRHRVRKNRTLLEAVDVVYEVLPDRVRMITVIVVARPLMRHR